MTFNRIFKYITDRPFIMALIVFVVAFIAYNYIFKKKSTAATTVASAAIPTYGRATIYNQEFKQYPVTPGVGIAPTFSPPMTTPNFPRTATVRASTGSVYDKQYGGVYLFSTPATPAGGGTSTTTVPFGSSITLLDSANGQPYGGSSGGGSSLYYRTAGGYISAQDVSL